ncbi:MAG TPA: DUF6785 family protein [Armatimonadota bacterium]|nr:DUF6785 family protein [Armatimonadota bacterium]
MEERAVSVRPEAEEQPVTPVTPRAVLTGAIAVATLGVINPYLAFVSRTWDVGSGSLLNSPVFVLFLLVLINSVLIRLWPGRSFTRAELLVVYGMLIVSVGLAMQGGLPYIVSATTFPFYMATPENGWEHMMWPHIPLFLRLTNPEYVTWFWEGAPKGSGIPWGVWLTPLLAWGGFTVALMAGMFSLAALMRKDWIERQRLAFPLVDVPLAVTGDDPRPSLRSSILNNRVFWLGFAIPAFFVCLQFFHRLYPSVPSPQLYAIEVGRYFAGKGLPWSVLSGDDGLKISIIFPVIGITCLLPAEVSLSLWLFYVLFRVQQLVWASFGIAEQGGAASTAINPQTFISFQEAGGFLAITGAALYQSRKAFRTAWSSLTGRTRESPDAYAPMAGRWALLIFLLANASMFWFADRSGMSWWSFGAIMLVFYAVLVGASRLVAAGGVMFVDTGFFPRSVVLRTLGALPVGAPSLMMYTYLSVIYMYDPMNLAMPQMMNSFKLVHSARLRGRAFTWAALVAIVAIVTFGLPALLRMLHTYGASSLGYWPFTDYPEWGFGELDATFRTPEPADNWLRLALVLGACFTVLLVWLHTQFVWWPLSPIGFIVASSYETNRSLWVNCFIAWALTTMVRRYGGLNLFRSFRPAFLGLVLGQYLPQGFFAIISSIFGIAQPMG